MDPIDSQVQRTASRSSIVELLLSVSAGIVFICGLYASMVVEAADRILVFAATIAVTAILIGFAAILGIHRARLLLTWRQQGQP